MIDRNDKVAKIRELLGEAGANDNRPRPFSPAELAAMAEQRCASDRRFIRWTATVLIPLTLIGLVVVKRWSDDTVEEQRRQDTAICANQSEILAHQPGKDEVLAAIVNPSDLATCQWMAKAEFDQMLTRPGVHRLMPH